MEDLKSLIKGAQTGDLDAFGRIVQQFQDMAVGYAYSILGDFHLAEDVTQEAFVEAYSCLPTLRKPEAFPGWFRKIVFKHCDRLTRRKRVETIPLEAAVKLPSKEKDPAEVVLEREMKSNVSAAIAALPKHERVATTLFYINGYSQNEIADFLEVPVTTVNSRLHYSRKRLKERLFTMVKEGLQGKRPSKNECFANKVMSEFNYKKVLITSLDSGKYRSLASTFTAAILTNTDRIMVFCQAGEEEGIPPAAGKVDEAIKATNKPVPVRWQFYAIDDLMVGFNQGRKWAKEIVSKKWYGDDDCEIIVNLVTESSVSQDAIKTIVELLRAKGLSVREIATIDGRSPEEQCRNPFVVGELIEVQQVVIG